MSKKISLLIVSIISFLMVTTDVFAYTSDSSEYKTCIANCEKYKGNSSEAYDSCMSPCNAGLDSKIESDRQAHEKRVQAAKSKNYVNIEFCAKTAMIWQIVGYVFFILKIAVPLILIITGIIELSKTVIGGKDDSLGGLFKKFMVKFIAALLIFFIPTIINLVMGLVTNFSDSGAKADYQICLNCITSPTSCDVSSDAGKN